MTALPALRVLIAVAATAVAATAKPILPATIFGDLPAPSPREVDDPAAQIAEPQFNSVPAPLPPNLPSLGYHITGTSEFGDLVRLRGAAHFVDSVTVTLSSWAIRSDYAGASPFGYSHPITLKIYEVDRPNGLQRPGRLLTRVTTAFMIPWRPEPDPTAPASPLRPWRGPDGNYYGGIAFSVTFDLSSLSLVLPDDVIVSVTFNTERHGEAPLGVEGPYNSLCVGLTATPPQVGSDLGPGAVYWRTGEAQFYSDSGAGGVDMLRLDAGWGAHAPAIRINNSGFGTLADVATQLAEWRAGDAAVLEAIKQARELLTSALDRNLWDGQRHVQPTWGTLVFDLLAEATVELDAVAHSRDPMAARAQPALESLVTVAHALADRALGEAAGTGGDFARLVRAEQALESAAAARAMARPEDAIDAYAAAWREAKLSSR